MSDLGRTIVETMSNEQISALGNHHREALGIRPARRSVAAKVVESVPFLAQRQALRSIFGLDTQWDLDTPYPVTTGASQTWSWYQQQMHMERSRQAMYLAAEEMDIGGGAPQVVLNELAGSATQPDPATGRTAWIESQDRELVKELHSMFDRVGLEDRVFGFTRRTSKYGDDFEQVIRDRTRGVVSLYRVRSDELTRVEDGYGQLRGFALGLIEDDVIEKMARERPEELAEIPTSEPWEFLHFRVMGGLRDGVHGESQVLGARRAWVMLRMMEDALTLFRVNKAPDRLLFTIDTGNQSVEDQLRTVNLFRQAYRKRMYIDPATGTMAQESSPFSVEEELFLPKNKDSETGVTQLSGSRGVSDIFDIEYMRKVLYSDLDAPPSFFGFDDRPSGKSLAQEDIRFARKVKRLQRANVYTMTQLCRIHLAIKGGRDAALKAKFKVRMAPISYLDELQRGELEQLQMGLAESVAGLLKSMSGVEDPETSTEIDRKAIIRVVLSDYLKWPKEKIRRLLGEDPEAADRPRDGRPPQRLIAASIDANGGLRSIQEKLEDVPGDALDLGDEGLPKKAEEGVTEDVGPKGGKVTVRKIQDDRILYDLSREKHKLEELLLERSREFRVKEMTSQCPACGSRQIQVVKREKMGREFLLCADCGGTTEIGRENEHSVFGAPVGGGAGGGA